MDKRRLMAYIMDLNEEERVKGKIVEVGRSQFETETTGFTILDAPAGWMAPEVLRNEPSNEKDPKKLRCTFAEMMAALKPLQKPIIASQSQVVRPGKHEKAQSSRVAADSAG
ncbi:hypothetical protein PIB30_013890 [Stylosanthes scabra]|uniref:Uncharacterized protein n=1 Tax=Stylosanthes scabra TaxID=79078 RepID=A0ABU6V7G4_9FABA|nr:hypothetical protein [Stylosanthes scabra]